MSMYPDLSTEPLVVIPVRGAVFVATGPAMTAMTPEAALASADQLAEAARLAASDLLPPLDLQT